MQKEVHNWTLNHSKGAPQSSVHISVNTYKFTINFRGNSQQVSQIGLEIKEAVFGILFLTLLYSISRFLPLQMTEFEENSWLSWFYKDTVNFFHLIVNFFLSSKTSKDPSSVYIPV